MKLVGNHIEGDVVGIPVLHLSEELTKRAKLQLATKIEFMDEIYLKVDELLYDGHIKSIMKNLESLRETFKAFEKKNFERKRSIK